MEASVRGGRCERVMCSKREALGELVLEVVVEADPQLLLLLLLLLQVLPLPPPAQPSTSAKITSPRETFRREFRQRAVTGGGNF